MPVSAGMWHNTSFYERMRSKQAVPVECVDIFNTFNGVFQPAFRERAPTPRSLSCFLIPAATRIPCLSASPPAPERSASLNWSAMICRWLCIGAAVSSHIPFYNMALWNNEPCLSLSGSVCVPSERAPPCFPWLLHLTTKPQGAQQSIQQSRFNFLRQMER